MQTEKQQILKSTVCFLFLGNIFVKEIGATGKEVSIILPTSYVKAPYVMPDLSLVKVKPQELNHTQHLHESLHDLPGVTIRTTGINGATSVFIRGGNSDYAPIVLDGVHIDEMVIAGTSTDIVSEGLSAVSLQKGAGAELENVEGLSGVIAAYTKKGQGPYRATLKVAGGSFETLQQSLKLEGELQNQKFDYHVTLSRSQAEGTVAKVQEIRQGPKESEASPFQNMQWASRTGYQINDRMRCNFINHIQSNTAEYADYYENSLNPAFIRKTLMHLHKVELVHETASFHKLFSYSFLLTDQSIEQENGPSISQKHYSGEHHSLYINYLWKYSQDIDFYMRSTFSHQIYKDNVEKENKRQNNSYHRDKFVGTLGSKIRISPYWRSGVTVRYQRFSSNNMEAYTGSAHTSYYFEKTHTTFLIKIGTAIKPPSFYQLYNSQYGNLRLKLEQSQGVDFGIQQEFLNKTLKGGVTYFRQAFKNLIEFDSQQNSRYYNIASAQTTGIELFSQWAFKRNWKLCADYVYLHTTDHKGMRLLRRPIQTFSFAIEHEFANSLRVKLKGIKHTKEVDINPRDNFKRQDLRSPWFFKLTASYQPEIMKKLLCFLKIENMTHQKFEQPLGYKVPGFAVYMGARMQLGA